MDFYCVLGREQRLMNVCYSIEHPTARQREVMGLLEAMQFFDTSEAFLLTADHEETIQIEGKAILAVPLWKWLLTFIPTQPTEQAQPA